MRTNGKCNNSHAPSLDNDCPCLYRKIDGSDFARLLVREGKVEPYGGAQWLSGRVLYSRPKGRGFEPHLRHCVVVLEQDTLILA